MKKLYILIVLVAMIIKIDLYGSVYRGTTFLRTPQLSNTLRNLLYHSKHELQQKAIPEMKAILQSGKKQYLRDMHIIVEGLKGAPRFSRELSSQTIQSLKQKASKIPLTMQRFQSSPLTKGGYAPLFLATGGIVGGAQLSKAKLKSAEEQRRAEYEAKKANIEWYIENKEKRIGIKKKSINAIEEKIERKKAKYGGWAYRLLAPDNALKASIQTLEKELEQSSLELKELITELESYKYKYNDLQKEYSNS